MEKWGLLFVAGGIGSIARYCLAGIVYQIMGTRFPYGTLVVNVLGCFIIGFIFSLAESKLFLSANMKLFLMVGFVGAFTTFSTFILETFNLLRDGQVILALTNVLASVILGFVVFYLGVLLGRTI